MSQKSAQLVVILQFFCTLPTYFQQSTYNMEENVNGLIQEAKKLCPVFFPSIFPQSFYPISVIDIFNKTEDQEIDDLFRLPACFCTEYSFTKKEILITQIKVLRGLSFNQLQIKIFNLIFRYAVSLTRFCRILIKLCSSYNRKVSRKLISCRQGFLSSTNILSLRMSSLSAINSSRYIVFFTRYGPS